MFLKLRNQFVLIAMTSVTCVLVGVISIINIFNFIQINRNANTILTYLSQNGGRFSEYSYNNPFSEETPYRTRFFTVSYNDQNGVTNINMGHVAAIQPSEAYNYAQNVINSGKTKGYYNFYKYLVTYNQNGYQIVFLDRRSELEGALVLLRNSILILIGTLLIIFFLIYYFSKPIIEPVIENALKQREFIANASHELKTPLSIISADTDVIEIENGPDEWTESIKDQVLRLNNLIGDLLMLSKLDDSVPKEITNEFNLKELVKNTAEEFEPIAVRDNKKFDFELTEEDLYFKGNKDSIERLISVLLNNAFKYSNNEGLIKLILRKKGREVLIDVLNTTDKMPEGNLKHLFDRFYRADNSRSRETGSYGIGLSIAKAITEQHKGSIAAKKLSSNTILFRAILHSI